MDNTLSEIRKSFLFKDVSDNDIISFIQNHPCKIVDFKRNDCVITREEVSKRIGIVLDGTLGIYSDSFYGGHTLIGIGGRHYLFGFIAGFYNSQHSITTLYCHDACRIAFFDIPNGQSAVEFIESTSPQILSNIYEMMTLHIKDDFDRQRIVSSMSVEVKLVRYLLYLHMEYNSDTLYLKMNRSELANFLDVYRTTLSREISRLESKGIIRCNRKQNTITVLDFEALIDIESNSYR